MSVNKKEFIEKMSKKGGIRKTQAEKALTLFLDTLMDSLKEDGVVKLYGFGRFELKTFKGHIGRNPKTEEKCFIPEHKKVKFYAGDCLIDRIECRDGEE